MNLSQDDLLAKKRFAELAIRADKQYRPCFTGFLSPPEAIWACEAANKAGVHAKLSGGYPEAERQMACFTPFDDGDEVFPFSALRLTWPHQTAPGHRDLLGAAMGLGVQRHCIGDIVLEEDKAYLFIVNEMAEHLRDGLTSAGRVKLQTAVLDSLPDITPPQGQTVTDTVASLRLDAVVAAGFSLSRAKAAELIVSGRVKLRHLPNLRTDAQVGEGDSISAQGMGRIRLEGIGNPTRKGRFPLTILRFGERKK